MEKLSHRTIDCHTHLVSIDEIDRLVAVMDAVGLAAINLLSLSNPMSPWYAKPGTPDWDRRSHTHDLTVNVAALLAKALHPDRVYVFGGLDHNTPEVLAGHHNYAEQAYELIDMGVDGFKMWMGPYMRAIIGLPLDAPEFDPFYSLLEENDLPLLIHGGSSRPEEVEGYLGKHPRLKVIYPHFGGYARDLPRGRQLLDTWPNTYLDVTPGWLFRAFSDNRDETRAFFVDYQDRILFGTDTAITNIPNDDVAAINAGIERCANRQRFIARFLERKEDLHLEELGMSRDDETNPALTEIQRATARERWAEHGLYLEDDVLNKVLAGNFQRLAGSHPRRVDVKRTLASCEQLLERVRQGSDDETKGPDGRSPAEIKAQNLEELERIIAQFRALA